MTTPIIYMSSDDNAPVLSGTRGSLIALLKACLVDGYGSKQAAGWTLEFISPDQTKAAFRNNSARGTGFFLQVDEAGSAQAYYPMLQGYEVMTDEDTGSGPFLSSPCQTGISKAASTASRAWIIIATDLAIFFQGYISSDPSKISGGILTDSTYVSWPFYFGDFQSFYDNDAYNCILVTTSHGTSYNACLGLFSMVEGVSGNAGNAVIGIPRDRSGTPNTRFNPQCCYGGGPVVRGNPGRIGPTSYVATDPLFLSQPSLGEPTAYYLRGNIPGFYNPCYEQEAFNCLEQITNNNRTFLNIKHGYPGYYRNFFIEIGDCWL